ncbi:hypothetical protein M5K25_012700 [Dendrobium thyrsiflorum]|uniref:SET domain-containing protein n=1 Tax=Dendrobium thyrsiflorum TaxID=117978 RepID=A0ABD0UY77_DENTH
MEIRAREGTPMSNDLTPAIPPIAASLHDKFLPSHCSPCFVRLPSSSSSTSLHSTSTNPSLSCSRCSATVQYCSTECAAADSDRHLSTGECSLFALCPPSPTEDTTDVRAALRLIHLFERLGLLPSPAPCRDSPRRIGGLLASGLVEVMDEGGELAERVREGATLMARARNSRMVEGCRLEKVSIEEEVLWAVMTNAVEVEIGELGGLGVAVYGPWFSWFNHSCVPNACYRFELSSGFKDTRPCDLGSFKVLPAGGVGEALDVWKTWTYVESSLASGLCWFGPRIIIRNIKPLKKDDEVCIAYTDLLQPKASRHFDLWSRYRFICHCMRCCASPQMYMDYILSINYKYVCCPNFTHCYRCFRRTEPAAPASVKSRRSVRCIRRIQAKSTRCFRLILVAASADSVPHRLASAESVQHCLASAESTPPSSVPTGKSFADSDFHRRRFCTALFRTDSSQLTVTGTSKAGARKNKTNTNRAKLGTEAELAKQFSNAGVKVVKLLKMSLVKNMMTIKLGEGSRVQFSETIIDTGHAGATLQFGTIADIMKFLPANNEEGVMLNEKITAD